jgi:hypothetical protein
MTTSLTGAEDDRLDEADYGGENQKCHESNSAEATERLKERLLVFTPRELA